MSLLIRTETRSVLRRWRFYLPLSLILALGLGVASTLANVGDAVIVRPIRSPTADRLIAFEALPGEAPLRVSPAQVRRLQASDIAPFAQFAGTGPPMRGECTLHARDVTITVPCARATPGFFALFGLAPLLQDATIGTYQPIVVGHDLWVRRLQPLGLKVGDVVSEPAFDPATLGTRPRMLRIAGVAPRGFYPGNADFWLPPDPDPFAEHFQDLVLWGLARPGVTAGSLATAAAPQWLSEVESVLGRDVHVRPLSAALIPDKSGILLVLLLATFGLLVTVWCQAASSLANEAMSPSRGLGTRLALGASRWRLVAEQSVGPVLVAVTALAVSQLVAVALHRRVMSSLPFMAGLRADYGMTTFWFAAGVLVMFVLAQSAIANHVIASRTGQIRAGLGAPTGRAGVLPAGLAGAAAAASIAFMYVSMVLAGGFYRTLQYDYGFDTRNLFVVHTTTTMAGVRAPAEREARRDDIERFARRTPGVVSVVRVKGVPFGTYNVSDIVTAEDGARRTVSAKIRRTSPSLFGTLGVPMLAGRDFREGDLPEGGAAIVTRGLADALWPNTSLLDARFMLEDRQHRVIGVVGDFSVRAARGTAPTVSPQVFLPATDGGDLLVRSSGKPGQAISTILAHAASHEEYLDVSSYSYDERRRIYATNEKAYAVFMGVIAVAAVLIGGLGAVVTVMQTCRRNLKAAAIRISLGATLPRALVAVALAPLIWLGVGALAGLAGGLAIGQALGTWVQHVKPIDPAAVSACVLIACLGLAISLFRSLGLLRRTDVVALLRDT